MIQDNGIHSAMLALRSSNHVLGEQHKYEAICSNALAILINRLADVSISDLGAVMHTIRRIIYC